MKIVLCTGGYDPIHSGHISYLNSARMLGDRLLVGLNSDHWLIEKKGKYFLPWGERKTILENLRAVDDILTFNDLDGSANEAIAQALLMYPSSEIIFANGGDRRDGLIPEQSRYANHARVKFVFGVGGWDKRNSSSKILKRWASLNQLVLDQITVDNPIG